jgi:hypothetical protein
LSLGGSEGRHPILLVMASKGMPKKPKGDRIAGIL